MDSLIDQVYKLMGLVNEVWHIGVAGQGFNRILISLIIISFFIILRGLFSRFVITFAKKIAKRTDTDFDDKLIDALEDPIKLIPVILGLFFAINYIHLNDNYENVANLFIRSLIVFAIFWGLYKVILPVILVFRGLESILTREMISWLVKFLHLAVLFIGGAAILEIWNIKVGPILAGFGLFGVAFALGAQDLSKNLIAGILVIAEKRMHEGDWIFVDGVVEGVVENIGFRSTLVRRFDKAPVYIPNAKLADNAVVNFSGMTHRRIKWLIGLEYNTSTDQLRVIRKKIEEYISSNPNFASPKDASTFIRVDSFNDSSIDLLLYCFTKTTDWGGWLEIKEDLAFAVKDIVETSGSGFAFPSRSIYFQQSKNDFPEVFIPPKKV
ncbi:MAG: mechanosensitive ion channel family protein [Pseudomonadota bacterium]|nr:mechanosensitive ion channel family protein [Pseudomonadota bacterium]